MEDLNNNANIIRKLLGKHQSYNVHTKRCNLCQNEKFRVAEEVRRKGGSADTEINICLHVAILTTS